jgi:hypothetical protein
MRQALIVKNPKWELFSTVSAEFKALAGNAVLVVRGTNKEKKTAKPVLKAVKAATGLSAFVLMFGLAAYAQQDITVMLPESNLAGSTTNVGPGNGVLGWNRDQIAVIGANIYSSNNVHISTKSNSIIRFDTSANGTDWSTNAYSLSLTTATFQTNGSANIARLTNTVGAKWLRIGAVENVNTNRVYFQRMTFSIDP